ncbi:MAG: ABC transporter ATP-binding protein [Rhizobiales bacterium]|nr:ABC transporter ATP-binding protein [Hyphomicrobiales bacterium]
MSDNSEKFGRSKRVSHWGARGTAGATIAASLSFDDICHDYDEVRAVDHFSLKIIPGEIVCLLGQSGCGKTTLLRIAAGIERQTSGRVLLNGHEIAGPAVYLPPEKRNIGLMFQDYALFPHMTILENVCFGLRDHKLKDAKQAALGVLSRVGMADYADQYPHVLSGGEQQRVALARAIVPKPGILLMDEPFSGLDQRLRANVRRETIALLHETRATCIIVTHDPEEAMQLADRIALMRKGHLVQVGTPEELYKSPIDIFVARFFSPVTEISAIVRSRKVETPLGVFSATGFSNGDKVVLGVRPQAVKITKTPGKYHGKIVHTEFLGDVDQVSVAVEGLEKNLMVRVAGGFEGQRGDLVGLKLDPRKLLMFAGKN